MFGLSAHSVDQIARFCRLWLAAFLTTGVLTSGSTGSHAIVAAVIGGAEVAFREVHPAV